MAVARLLRVLAATAAVAAPLAAGTAVGVLTTDRGPTRVSSLLAIVQPRPVAEAIDHPTLVRLGVLRDNLAALATSDAVDQAAAAHVGIDVTRLRSELTAVAKPGTLLLTVSSTDPDRGRATAVTDAVTGQLILLATVSQAHHLPGPERPFALVRVVPDLATRTGGSAGPVTWGLAAAAGLAAVEGAAFLLARRRRAS